MLSAHNGKHSTDMEVSLHVLLVSFGKLLGPAKCCILFVFRALLQPRENTQLRFLEKRIALGEVASQSARAACELKHRFPCILQQSHGTRSASATVRFEWHFEFHDTGPFEYRSWSYSQFHYSHRFPGTGTSGSNTAYFVLTVLYGMEKSSEETSGSPPREAFRGCCLGSLVQCLTCLEFGYLMTRYKVFFDSLYKLLPWLHSYYPTNPTYSLESPTHQTASYT